MSNDELLSHAAALLRLPPYYTLATESGGQPWSSPVWAARDAEGALYWSSWTQAVHSQNVARNPRVFLTLFDSTRARGTNNLRGLYLQAVAEAVADPAEAEKAFALLYPGEAVDVGDFLGDGPKRFYRARPVRAWLNCASERELTPATTKMRLDLPLDVLRAAALLGESAA